MKVLSIAVCILFISIAVEAQVGGALGIVEGLLSPGTGVVSNVPGSGTATGAVPLFGILNGLIGTVTANLP